MFPAVCCSLLGGHLAFLCALWQTPIRRIDNQRGALIVSQVDPAFVPELVIREDTSLCSRLVTCTSSTLNWIEEIAILPRSF